MQFSPAQDAALKAVDHWYKNERQRKQTFYLAGYAGSGKSTLAKHFAQNIEGQVNYAAFTGKAAHVMAQKGCTGATTIHRLIYIPKPASRARLRELTEQLEQHKAAAEPDFDKIHALEAALAEEEQNSGRMNFALNHESDLQHAKLLIVDEVSMVSQIMGDDLLSFNVPILVLGDPAQLPPVFGTGYFTEQKPDIMLDEIHRQSLDNPIIAMSKTVREGGRLNLGKYGDSKVTNEKLEASEVLSQDMILVGRRKTKATYDRRCRALLGYGNVFPLKNDKLMCVKNCHDLGLLNGQIWIMQEDSVVLGDGTVSLFIREPESGGEQVVSAAEEPFLGKEINRWGHEQHIQEFEYAYASTVHKAQGSQWDNILLQDEKDSFVQWPENMRRRWLYTAITRAAKRITIFRL